MDSLLVFCSNTLVLDPVRMSNAGNYTCVAEIPGASSSKTTYLNVIPDNNGPIVWAENPKNVRAQIGDDVTIECQPTSEFYDPFLQCLISIYFTVSIQYNQKFIEYSCCIF